MSVVTPGGDTPSSPTGTAEFESSTNHGTTGPQWRRARPRRSSGATRHMTALLECSVVFQVSQSGIEFKAGYSGNSDYSTSVSDPVTQTVGKSLTSTV